MNRYRWMMLIMVVSVASCFLSGCTIWSSVGDLQVESQNADPVILAFEPTEAVYSHDVSGESSFWISDIPLDDLLSGTITHGQIMHIELFWVPKPGKTPMDDSATNAIIRHIILEDCELGIYGGAGFIVPRGKLGKRTAHLSIAQASLTLQDKTAGFADLLTPAQLTGDISAELDDALARNLKYTVSQHVTDALGYSKLVDLDRPIEHHWLRGRKTNSPHFIPYQDYELDVHHHPVNFDLQPEIFEIFTRSSR